MKRKIMAATAGLALMSSVGLASASNLVTNGDFSSDLDSWTASDGQIDAIEETDYDGIHGVARPGVNYWVAFGGGQFPGGTLSQSLSTMVGQLYRLTFTYGAWGDSNGQQLEVTAGNDLTELLSVGVSDLTKDWATLATKTFSFEFTATSASTLLSFKDTSFTSNNADGVLAGVSVTAVPGPEAGAGLGALGIGAAAFFLKRRKAIA